MSDVRVHYTSPDEDSARWIGFPFRSGDIVISTRSKSGTTWLQMICALLIFGTPDLPEPLATLSPWLDWLVRPEDEVYDQLAAQRHRRFIKSHTPLDGLPVDPLVTYLVSGRHPLDMAVSLYHQGENLNRGHVGQLLGQTEPTDRRRRPPLYEWLVDWIEDDADPGVDLDSLPGVMAHLAGAWQRRHDANVVLVHYDDLRDDLKGQMGRLASRLDIDVPEASWPGLVEAATFSSMRSRAAWMAPDPSGILKDPTAFFRRGTSGAGREVLSADDLRDYYARAERLAPPDLLAWLHRERPTDAAPG